MSDTNLAASGAVVSDGLQLKLKEILQVTVPIMLSQVIMTLGGFISALMLSRLSETVFAASMLIASIQLAVVTVVFGVLYVLSAMISRVVGEEQQPHRVGTIFGGGCALALLASIPLILLMLYVEPLLIAAGQPADLAEICGVYFRIFVWSVPASALLSVYTQFLMGVFRQEIVFLFSVFSLLFTTLLSYALIFGKWGAPALGIEGLAWALNISAWLGVALLSLHILSSPQYKVYQLFTSKLQQIRQSVAQTCRLGLPVSLQMGNELFSFLVTTLMTGWLGFQALEAKQVISRYLMLLIIPIFGIAQASTVLIGKHLGAKHYDTVRSYGKICIGFGIGYALIILLLFTLMPEAFINVFVTDAMASQTLTELLVTLLVLVAIGQVFDAVRNVATGALRGLQDTRYPMLVSVILIWPVGIPLAYCMGFTWGWGLIGITVAHNIVMVISSVILLNRWLYKVKGLESGQAPG